MADDNMSMEEAEMDFKKKMANILGQSKFLCEMR